MAIFTLDNTGKSNNTSTEVIVNVSAESEWFWVMNLADTAVVWTLDANSAVDFYEVERDTEVDATGINEDKFLADGSGKIIIPGQTGMLLRATTSGNHDVHVTAGSLATQHGTGVHGGNQIIIEEASSI